LTVSSWRLVFIVAATAAANPRSAKSITGLYPPESAIHLWQKNPNGDRDDYAQFFFRRVLGFLAF